MIPFSELWLLEILVDGVWTPALYNQVEPGDVYRLRRGTVIHENKAGQTQWTAASCVRILVKDD